MRYQVPQFIEVEDKIFGPFTLKQFIYLAGGAGVGLALFTLLPLYIGVFFALPVGALALALAFYKINGQPFIATLENGLKYVFGSKLYLWKAGRPASQIPQAPQPLASAGGGFITKLSESKLKDLAWSLNIKDRRQL